MRFAIVNVLPDPVTPISVWSFLPARSPSVSRLIAAGWSPAGFIALFSSNFAIYFILTNLAFSPLYSNPELFPICDFEL
jgi:predicted membrane metal-binding protein